VTIKLLLIHIALGIIGVLLLDVLVLTPWLKQKVEEEEESWRRER